MMYFCFKFICFSWIFNCIWIAADKATPTNISACPAKLFEITNLSHSSLLVKWDPNKIKLYDVNITWYIHLDEGNSESNRSIFCLRYDGRCKIPSLKENTRYRIEIKYKQTSKCWLVGKTILKTIHSIPTKPDFEIKTAKSKTVSTHLKNYFQPVVEIQWLPCGRKGYCEEKEVAGSHFFVKYKMLYSRQEWKIHEYDRMNTFLYGLLHGRPYEVVITSINTENGDFETDSDPHEVLLPAVCSSVRSVKIMTLTNSSVLISWKPPKQCQQDVKFDGKYAIFYIVSDSSPIIFLNYSYFESPYKEQLSADFLIDGSSFAQAQIPDLTSGTCYTFFIIPTIYRGVHGFEYRIDYTLKTYQKSLLLTQPDLYYKLNIKVCWLNIWWLPCGREYDCKDTKPGSYFLVKYRNMTDKTDWEKVETSHVVSVLYLRKDQEYKISVESRDEYNNSKSSMGQMLQTSTCEKDMFTS